MQITERKYIELSKELRTVTVQIDEALKEVRDAAALGDLKENEEYATARSNSERLINRKSEIESILAEAVVVEADKSPIITIGSTIRVSREDRPGVIRTFVLENSGNTVLDGILGVDSPLGKEILNGTDGNYYVHVNGGIKYHVEKVIE